MAGWDDFLTERDKQLLAISGISSISRGKHRRYAEGERPALLVIDVYYASVGHERKPLFESIKDWPGSCGLEGWEAIDRMVGLIAAARAHNVPVIYVRRMSDFPGDRIEAKNIAKVVKKAGTDRLSPDIRGLANEIVAEVAPQPGEWVLGKTAPSAFANTPLLPYLRQLNIDTLIVCGEATSGCVRATVVDGATYRYRIGIVGECCYDRTEASHWMNLFDMDRKYGSMIDVKTAAAYFATLKPQAQA